MILLVIFFIVVFFLIQIFAAPFPYWPSYVRVWWSVISYRDKQITFRARIKNILFLIKDLFMFSILTICWYIDELLFPQYRFVSCELVVCILGQPRSGSTFLHRIFGEDEENFVSIKHLEWRYPFIFLQKLFEFTGLEGWLSKKNYWPNNAAGNLASKMHPHYLGVYEEDGVFFEERFYHHYFIFRRFPYPNLMPRISSFLSLPERVQDRMLAMHKRVIQKVVYRRGYGRALVLKENESMELMPKIAALYPKVIFVGIVREPNKMLRSYEQLSRLSTLAKINVDPNAITGWASKNLAKRKTECDLMVAFFQKHASEDSRITISYNHFIKNILNTIRYIYSKIGLELSIKHIQYLKHLEHLQQHRDPGYVLQGSSVHAGFKAFNDFVLEVHKEHGKGLLFL